VNDDPRHDEDAADDEPVGEAAAEESSREANGVQADEGAVELDAVGTTPEDAVAEQLRDALGELRSEADRIATLGTGEQQVEAAEKFAEDAGRFDEQVGAAARAADEDASS
jgi:hypothetical protein